jgi:hypothetical protein
MIFFRNFLIVFFFFYLPIGFVFSQELIRDSYIIFFKANAGIIDPPNPANAGQVPMGQPTSGQNKDELATTLELNGEIVAILEANNGIIVNINAQEAEKWRRDERVASITKGGEGSFENSLLVPNDFPIYHDGLLIIPRVDTDQQAGIFQSGLFQHDPTTDTWQLKEFQVAPVAQIFLVEDDGVEAVVTNFIPAQVFLKVKGNFSDSCRVVGRVDQRLNENSFEVVISIRNTAPSNGSEGCFQVLTPFEKIVPLQVYGLDAGVYEYSVNGERSGTFELVSDNNLQLN